MYSLVKKFGIACLYLAVNSAGQAVAQDIAVVGDTQVLIPDGSSASEQLGTVFYPIPVAGSSSGIFFEVYNTAASGNLTISSITDSGAHAADFYVGSISGTTVPPGEKMTFGVGCDPSAAGDRNVTITINSNDPDSENAYTFNVRCFGYNDSSEIVPKANLNVGILKEPRARTSKAGTTRFKSKLHVGNLGRVGVDDPILQVYYSASPYYVPAELVYEKELKPFPPYTVVDDFKRKNVKVSLKIPATSGYVFARIVSAGSVSEYNYGDNIEKMKFGDN